MNHLTLAKNILRDNWTFFAVVALVVAGVIGVQTWRDRRSIDAAGRSETRAEAAQDAGRVAEGEANAHRERAVALETEAARAETSYRSADRERRRGSQSLKQERTKYEESRNTQPRVDDGATLDERERRVLAALRELYPEQ